MQLVTFTLSGQEKATASLGQVESNEGDIMFLSQPPTRPLQLLLLQGLIQELQAVLDELPRATHAGCLGGRGVTCLANQN